MRNGLQRVRGTVARVRRVRGGDATLAGLAAGSVSVLVLAAAATSWDVAADAASDVDRVTVFDSLDDRPPATFNGSVDVLFAATERAADAPATTNELTYLVLAHISRRHDTTVLVDVPERSAVAVREHSDRAGERVAAGLLPLSSAYSHGGPALLVEAFETATSVRVDAYAELSLPAVGAAIETAGGIELCVPAAVEDEAVGLDLPAGMQRLDGDQAAAFLRSEAGGALERVRRAQLFFGAGVRRLFDATAAVNLVSDDTLLGAGSAAVRVDSEFDLATSRRLALALRDPYGNDTSIVSVPVGGEKRTDHGKVATWQERLAGRLFEELRKDAVIDSDLFTPTPVSVPPESVEVRVRNGTDITGLAAEATEDLAELGFTVRGKPENAEKATATTTIYYGDAQEKRARSLAAAIPGARLHETKTQDGTLLMVLGPDYGGARPVMHLEGADLGSAAARHQLTGAGACAPSG